MPPLDNDDVQVRAAHDPLGWGTQLRLVHNVTSSTSCIQVRLIINKITILTSGGP